jgi:hypothetical protein
MGSGFMLRKADPTQLRSRAPRCARFLLAELLEECLRSPHFRCVDARLEQLQDNGRIACGVGCGSGAFDAPVKPLRGHQRSGVFEKRPEPACGGADVVQTIFIRFADEAPARSLERSKFAAESLLQPLHRNGLAHARRFDGGV